MIRWWPEPVLDLLFAPRHEDGTPCRHRGHACGQVRGPWRVRVSRWLRRKT